MMELVGNAQAHLAGLLAHDRLGHEVGHDLLVDSEELGLLRGDHRAELPPEPLQLVVVGIANLIDRDLGIADLRDRGRSAGAENVPDAPDREAQDQNAEQDGGYDLADQALPGQAHSSKHREPVM
jgi:hypothetical protein